MTVRRSPNRLASRNIAILLFMCMFMIQTRYVYSQEAWDEHTSRGFGETIKYGALASGYSLLKNSLTMFFNHCVIGFYWALPTARAVQLDFTTPWIWEETDGFLVNFLGHPFQGSVYFSSGRITGFGFYQSLFFGALGSATWEVFFANQRASINDLFSTAPPALSLGEILFRLYLQAHAAGVPDIVSFFFNPAAVVHRLVTGWEPPQVESNFYDFQIYAAGGYSRTEYFVSGSSIAGGRQELFSHGGPFADLGFRIVYGDPFVQHTRVPFRHFEFLASFGTDVLNQNDFRVFSDGYLFSFSPLYTGTRALSTGLSLHMDFAAIGESNIHDATINMYSNALSWTVKYRHLFSPNIGWRARAHAGFIFFGASNYHSPEGLSKTELKNYGYGINLKHLSSVEFGRRSRFDVNNFLYFMWRYPGTSALSQGFVWWQFHDFSFSSLVSQRISLGTAFSIATERGSFGEFPSTRKNHWSARTFVAWNGQSIRNDRRDS